MTTRRIVTTIFVILVTAAGLYQHTYNLTPSQPTDLVVSRIVDGDTFELMIDGTKEKVRMLGIDTPESVDPRKPVQCFGKEASAHLSAFILKQHVRLEADPTNDDRDGYKRLLRYVYLDDNTFVNARMIQDGYAYAYTRFPFVHRDAFVGHQKDAREALRGLWAADTCNGRP